MNGKHALLVLLTGTLFGLLGISCNRGTSGKPPQAIDPTDVASVAADHTGEKTTAVYELIPGKPMMWKGTTVMGGSHEGTLQLTSGWIGTSSDGKITEGDFIIDMNSIKNTDQADAKGRRNLEAHLMNNDFFAVDSFPTAHFTITAVVPSNQTNSYTVTGKLLLKGIQNSIQFPATIAIRNDTLHVSAACSIDRTQWGIYYDSETNLLNRIKNQGIANKMDISLDLLFRLKD